MSKSIDGRERGASMARSPAGPLDDLAAREVAHELHLVTVFIEKEDDSMRIISARRARSHERTRHEKNVYS